MDFVTHSQVEIPSRTGQPASGVVAQVNLLFAPPGANVGRLERTCLGRTRSGLMAWLDYYLSLAEQMSSSSPLA